MPENQNCWMVYVYYIDYIMTSGLIWVFYKSLSGRQCQKHGRTNSPSLCSMRGGNGKPLLDHRSDFSAKDKNGNTPLYLARILEMQDVVKRLLTKAAEISAKTHDGGKR